MSGIRARTINRLLLVVSLATIFGASLALAAGPKQTTFSGRAYAAFVNTSVTGPIFLGDTGSLSSSGGVLSNSLLSASVPGVLSAEVLHGTTSGSHGSADSQASVANVSVFPGTPY